MSSRWVEFIFFACASNSCIAFTGSVRRVLRCSRPAWRAVRGASRKATPPRRKREGAPESVASPGCAKGDPHFAAKIIVLFFCCKVMVFFYFRFPFWGEIPQACGEVDDKRHIVPPRGERRPSRLHQNAQAMPSVSTFAPPPC